MESRGKVLCLFIYVIWFDCDCIILICWSKVAVYWLKRSLNLFLSKNLVKRIIEVTSLIRKLDAEWTWSFKIKLFLVVFFILAFQSSIYFSTEFGVMNLDSELRFVNGKWNPFFILISCRNSVQKAHMKEHICHFPLENCHLCSLARKYRERKGFLLLPLIWSWWL